jgi:hypothetical protein
MTNDEWRMTNDEGNPKPECRTRRSGEIALSSFGFRYSFGFRHSSFGFLNCGSWKSLDDSKIVLCSHESMAAILIW